MNTETVKSEYAKEISATILEQLGGRKFIAMTSSKNFGFGTDKDGNPYLQMDISSNLGKVNRLRITYNHSDTYTMYFFNIRINGRAKNSEDLIKISNEVTKEMVYAYMLCFLFTKVTHLYCSL